MADVDTVLYLRERVAKAELERGTVLDINQRASLERAIKRVEPIYSALSLPTPEPKANEHAFQYRRRIVEDLKGHSPRWARTNPSRVRDDEGFAVIEMAVLSAAERDGLDPLYRGHARSGQLRERKVVDASGNVGTVFHGDPKDCWAPFCGPVQTACTEFRTPQGRRLYPR